MSKLLLNKLGFNFIITNFFLLILNNLKVVDAIKCYYYPYTTKTYRYSTECYTCCSETAYSASDACCDTADSFAALLILITILVCISCLSCITGILVFIFCYKKKPRQTTNDLSSHFQSVVNPAFCSKVENVNELPKYEDLSHSNIENNNTETVVQNQEEIAEASPSSSQEQLQDNNAENIQMSEINLNSNDIATNKNQKNETTTDNNNNNNSNNNSVRTEISQV